MSSRVSSDMVFHHSHGHVGVPDPHHGPVGEGGLGDLATIHEHAVGGAQVVDNHLDALLAGVGDLELHVPSADTGVGDPDVGLAAAAHDQAGGLQRVSGAVDLQDGA